MNILNKLISWLDRLAPINIPILPLHKEGGSKQATQIPEYKTKFASCMDVCAYIEHDKSKKDWYQDTFIMVDPGKSTTIPTGFCLGVPEGWEVQIRPRSGLSKNHGINAILGTIDSDYRGQVHVILDNITETAYKVHHGDRIAQMVPKRSKRARLIVVDKLSETERGAGGFGHTGK